MDFGWLQYFAKRKKKHLGEALEKIKAGENYLPLLNLPIQYFLGLYNPDYIFFTCFFFLGRVDDSWFYFVTADIWTELHYPNMHIGENC